MTYAPTHEKELLNRSYRRRMVLSRVLSEAPFAREVRSGEYAEPPDFEMRDYVSNDKVVRRAAGAACEEAEVVLQEFFEQNPPLVSRSTAS